MRLFRISKAVYVLFAFLLMTSPPELEAKDSSDNRSMASTRDVNFNQGWRFHHGDVQDAASPGFDDSKWRLVDLPHDISIEDLPVQDDKHVGPFFKGTKGGPSVGYLQGGVAWYRKELLREADLRRQQVFLHFDGIQSEAIVFVNGKEVGNHVYGYAPFYFNITQYLSETGEANTIAVKVTNPEDHSRWYPGFGIYRDVTLSVLQPVHVQPWGVYVTTPRIEGNEAEVAIAVQIANTSSVEHTVTIKADILDPDLSLQQSKPHELTLPPNTSTSAKISAVLKDAQLWDLDSPQLYTAKISIHDQGAEVDQYVARFGVRSIEFSPENGFLLNGNNVLLKGACMHHDNGILGAAAFRDAEYRRVKIMKSNGYNAIRCSHNPPSSHFLDACDDIGVLVVDEAFDMWELPKRKKDYHVYFNEWWQRDLQAMILRDRNHPCIIMWSYGNEIQERCRPRGLEIAQQLVEEIRNFDTSRPTSQAMNGFWDNRGMNWERNTPAAFEIMDIGGYNYKPEKYESDHKDYPERIMYGSESYPMEAFEYWQKVEQLPYLIGDFVWTGMDYIGESGIGIAKIVKKQQNLHHPQKWPWFNANCGDIDLIGGKKPQSYYRDVLWGESNVEILVHEVIPKGFFEQKHAWGWPLEYPHWNWEGHEGELISVNVYANCPKVRLELNGKLIGVKDIDLKQGITASFEVPYAPGELKATAIRDGREETKRLITAGRPDGLKLQVEQSTVKADRNGLIFVAVSAVDENDRLVPIAALPLKAQITGEGELLAAGNSFPLIEGGFQDEQFRLHQGRGLIVVRSSGNQGDIVVSVTAENGLVAKTRVKAVK